MNEPAPRYTRLEELAHTYTHGAALLLSLIGAGALLRAAIETGSVWHIVGAAVFGFTLVLLYASSTLYHALRHPPAKQFLRRCDHASIFLLIAGTYTPFTLVSLRGPWGFSLLAVVWGLAALGISMELVVLSRSRRLSVVLHLVMGWLILVAIEPLRHAVPPNGLYLLALGGIVYTLGVAFYAWERLPFNHAVWHLFVMGGSALHFSCVLGYLMPRVA